VNTESLTIVDYSDRQRLRRKRKDKKRKVKQRTKKKQKQKHTERRKKKREKKRKRFSHWGRVPLSIDYKNSLPDLLIGRRSCDDVTVHRDQCHTGLHRPRRRIDPHTWV